jgi:hypothetical protein
LLRGKVEESDSANHSLLGDHHPSPRWAVMEAGPSGAHEVVRHGWVVNVVKTETKGFAHRWKWVLGEEGS